MIVYKITNIINGKIYIGKDVKNDPKYFGSGLLLNAAMKKYGKEFFVKETVEECMDQNELAEREKYWIKHFDSTNRKLGYNIAEGGFGGDTFSSNPNKEIIREKHKDATSKRNKRDGGWSPDPLKRVEMAKVANAARTANGYRHSEETKRKLSNTLTGRVITAEWRKNISIATKEAMAKIDQKELQQKALEGRKKAWAARDEKRKEELKEILKLGLKAPENIKMLGVSPPTYYKILNMIKN
jgi:group I intron endonuclease